MNNTYNIQIPGDKIWEDNRENNLKGKLSQPGDIDEAFRAVCALNSAKITEIRALIKDKNNPVTLSGLMKTCIHFKIVLVVDGAMDFFCVKHQEKGDVPVSLPGNDAPEDAGALRTDEAEATEREDNRFKEIESDDPVSDEMKVDEDDDEDLF